MPDGATPPAAALAPERRPRDRRPIGLFLAGSLVAHAALLILLPEYSLDPGPSRPAVFQVTILEPVPLSVAPPAPATAPAAVPEPARQAATETSRTEPAKAASAPVPAAPPTPAGSFMVAPPTPPALEPGALPPAVEVTPPLFNAAYLNNPAPGYPAASRRAGEQGTVTLRVLVKRDGLPARVEVEKSSGSRNLDGAAVDAVWAWRFVPARQGTDPVESWVLVPVVFRLEGSG